MCADGPEPSPETPAPPAGQPPVTPSKRDQLWERVYADVKRLAKRQRAAERAAHTLSTTAIVHEVYLRLEAERVVDSENLALFFTQAARAMRRVLVDYARQYRAQRRGGGKPHVAIDALGLDGTDSGSGTQIPVEERAEELVALDEALERLAAFDARLAQVIECRFFAGLTEEETASVLGVATRTVGRDWKTARAWLRQALEEPPAHER